MIATFGNFMAGVGGANFGLLSDLWDQVGNLSANIEGRTFYIGSPATKGNWNSSTAYGQTELRAYPSGAPMMWRVKNGQSVSSGEAPPPDNSKWEPAVGFEMVQDMSNGKRVRTTLQIDEGGEIKQGPVEVGNYALSRFSDNQSLPPNYVGNGPITISTSTTSITIPTSHPGSRTITIGTGLTIPNSTGIGSCTDNFAIPTTHPTMMTRNLPTGLSVTAGSTITFYGDANNFFVFVVARYNSTTGVSYGFSVNHVGTGTFSSWTLKTEKLRRVYRTANQTGQYMVVLVQSYDSGTGAFTFNSIKNVGTGTVSDWTVALVKEATDPTAAANTQFNYLDAETTTCWFVVSGIGTSFQHRCTVDNRGTGWVYIYADGPSLSSPPADVTIDTYNASSLSAQSKLTFDDLPVGTHTFVAVSIISPSGLSANTRAWVNASTNVANVQTLNQLYNYHAWTADFVALDQAQSVGEFAYRFRENADAGDVLEWVWYHGLLTLTSNHSFVIDGVTINHLNNFRTGLNPYALKYQPFVMCVVNQSGNLLHTQAVAPVGSYTSIHTINKKGGDFVGNLSWSVATLRSVGYEGMMFLTKQFCKRIKFGLTGNVYTPPINAEPDVVLNSGDLIQGSVIAYNDGTGVAGEPNYVVAAYTGDNPRPLLPLAYINNYDATHVKLYPQTYSNEVIPASTVETVKYKWYAGLRGTLV